MRHLLAGAVALAALLCAPVMAQDTGSLGGNGINGFGVDKAHPLPITTRTQPAESATLTFTPPVGNSSSSGFLPQLGRPIRVVIRGTWTGTVQLGTSAASDCSTFNPLTIGGQSWGSFTGNANEAVDEPYLAGIYYCVQASISSGAPTIGVRQ